MESLRRRCREIAQDATSGATALSLRAADVLLDAILAGRGPEVADEIRMAKPVMASLLNLAALAEGDPAEALRRIREYRTGLIEGPRLAARAAADWLTRRFPGRLDLVTISASAAVEETLLELGRRDGVASLVVGESQPALEGTALAARLRLVLPRVSVTRDAALPGQIGPSSAVLFGADAVTDDAVFNKAGSLALALAARRLHRPVFAVTTTHKVVPPASVDLFLAAEAGMQAGARQESPGYEPPFWDVQFEAVPRELLSGVFGERGRIRRVRKPS